MTQQPTIEEFMVLQQALQTSLSQQEKLTSELRFVSTERDLLKQRLDKMLRKFFAAKSEARGTEQKDMFFNEAEALAAVAQATPALQDGAAGEDSGDAAVAVPAHQRLKRGRKPLDADLPRHIVRHELPESERVCPHDGCALREIGVEASEQLDIIQLTSQSQQQAQATVKSTQTPSTPQQQKQQVLPKAFTDTAQSNAATRPLPSSTAASLAAQNAVRARSIAQTQRSLYPLAHDEVVKRLTS